MVIYCAVQKPQVRIRKGKTVSKCTKLILLLECLYFTTQVEKNENKCYRPCDGR